MKKKIRYPEEFRKDSVFQVTDRGYSVTEVSVRLGYYYEVVVRRDQAVYKT